MTRSTRMDAFEQTLHAFMASPQYKGVLVTHCCHTRTWLYNCGQVLWVELLPSGTWNAPAPGGWSRAGSEHLRTKSCITVLEQLNSHFSYLKQLGETRDFETILLTNPGEAHALAERLYVQQETYVRERTHSLFALLKERNELD